MVHHYSACDNFDHVRLEADVTSTNCAVEKVIFKISFALFILQNLNEEIRIKFLRNYYFLFLAFNMFQNIDFI